MKERICSPMRILLLIGIFALMSGCARLNPENMIADAEDYDIHHKGSVALEVGKSSSGEGWYSGSIKPKQFEQSIRNSLTNSRLFDEVTAEQLAKYIIQANITYTGSHPGFNMTAWVNVNWKLVRYNGAEVIWSKQINSKGRATVGEAFNGRKRQYMAIERAGKANIEEALREIGKLEL